MEKEYKMGRWKRGRIVCGVGSEVDLGGEGGEEQADVNGQLATQLQGKAWSRPPSGAFKQ